MWIRSTYAKLIAPCELYKLDSILNLVIFEVSPVHIEFYITRLDSNIEFYIRIYPHCSKAVFVTIQKYDGQSL
jgi:hypothetical protein